MRETIPANLAGERVDRVVALLTGLPRSEVAELVERGQVSLDGDRSFARSRRVRGGEVLEVDLPAPGAKAPGRAPVAPDPAVDVVVLHADADVVVVDKPAGLVVHPGAGHAGATLVHGLVARFPEIASVGDPTRPGIVHRLDKGTSGLMVVARSAAAFASLVQQLQERSVAREYLALVRGLVGSDAGLVDAPVGRSERDRVRMAVAATGREARTRYRVQERFRRDEVTLVACILETGRTHQIRVHLAAIGHPVVGDPQYGRGGPGRGLGRPFLHAHKLAFDHPRTGRRMQFASPLPGELQALLHQLS